MAIYLVQHGLCLRKEEDPERPLSEAGVAQVQLLGGVAAGYGVQVSRIYHSGKKRAQQTAELFSAALLPADGISVRSGLGPNDDVVAFSQGLVRDGREMYVGHLPFMERLVSQLVTGCTEYLPLRFQNGGIVCMEREEGEGRWFIKWALMPNIG